MVRKVIASLTMLALLGTQAEAAFLQLQGAASVDNGSGFIPAVGNMLVKPGDRIRVTAGCAQVIYDNGYLNKICKGQLAVVFSDPPQPAPGGGSLKDTPVYEPAGTGDDWLTAGGIVLGGIGIGTAIALSQNNESFRESPASP
ncbi:MAG: hypothetical protein WBX25_16855 [Rhodomicrobium sp.]